jgi:FtsP/CotA-like multicopper oxidase with cupredoxin domain
LHASPAPGADDVFLELPPGERTHIEIPLPEDHRGGIFWYHPHKHGGVCQQLRGGMAGMLIVRGEIDGVPEVKAAGQPVTPFWRDTHVIDTPGDSATFQSNFVDFTGKTVDHCHIVSHEDLGMMEAVEIVN